jgi:hypothetical protein
MKTVGMPVHIPVGMIVDIVVLEQASAKLPEENATNGR